VAFPPLGEDCADLLEDSTSGRDQLQDARTGEETLCVIIVPVNEQGRGRATFTTSHGPDETGKHTGCVGEPLTVMLG